MKLFQTTLDNLEMQEMPLDEKFLSVYVVLSSGERFTIAEDEGELVIRRDGGGMKIIPHVSNTVSLGAAE